MMRAVVHIGFHKTARSSRAMSTADEMRLQNLLPRFEGSNANLERLTGLNLADYGYRLPAATSVELRGDDDDGLGP